MAQKANICYVYPCGAQRGETVEVTVGGQNFRDVSNVTISGTGVKAELVQDSTAVRTFRKRRNIGDEDNLQFAERVKVRITIDPKAELGMRDLKLESQAGVSNRLFFEIGQYPNFVEEGKSSLEKPNKVPSLPCTLNGQIMAAERDYFQFSAKKGETIVLRTQARAFIPYIADAVPGWFQSILTLYNEQGREVAYCDDYMFHVDPVIIFKVPESGKYSVEIKDALYRGREDFTYRIDVGQIPFITSIFPLGGRQGSTVNLALTGANLKSNTMTLKVPKSDNRYLEVSRTTPDNKYVSNNMRFELSSLKEVREAEPNDDTQSAQHVEAGMIVNGTVSKPSDRDWYKFDVQAGSTMVFEVTARKLGSPLDAKLTLYNSRGKVLAEVDDVEDQSEGMLTHHADPVIVHKFSEGGTCFLRLIDAQGKGGDNYAYRLKIDRPEPSFALNIDPSSLFIPRGGTAFLNVTAIRKQSFNGDIEVNIKGLPKGCKVSHNIISSRASKLMMTITAPLNVKEEKLNLEVTGKAVSREGGSVIRVATPAESAMQAFYYTHLVPAEALSAEIAPKQPVVLSIDDSCNPLRIVPGEPTPLKVRIEREENFKDTITVMLRPGGVNLFTTTAVKAGPEEREVTLLVELRRPPNSNFNLKQLATRASNMGARLYVMGATRSTTARIAGQSRQAFISSVTVYAPAVEVKFTDINENRRSGNYNFPGNNRQ